MLDLSTLVIVLIAITVAALIVFALMSLVFIDFMLDVFGIKKDGK